MGRIVGIDLGTTTSEIAYIKNGKPEMIINDLGKRITPSVVGITDDGEVIVGEKAKRQAALKPEKTILEVKRLMGQDIKVKLDDKEVSPIEISAVILKNLKAYAEEVLGEKVTEAVITVPAKFNDLQRQATKEAGERAGFKVERIINEPTAAALAYGIENLEEEAKVLVYDLGGGTFDVTVLELCDGILEVKASRGNNELGGKDFDTRIENYLIEEFKKVNGIDLKKNLKAIARIKEAAEIAKIELSTMNTTEINIPFISMNSEGEPLEIDFKLTRAKFEELVLDLVISTKIEINDAIKASGYKKEEINRVLVVGGSTRIALVQKLLKEEFGNRITAGLNPDEAVSLGAAVQAGIKNNEVSSEDSLIVTDVCSHTLGIQVIGEEKDWGVGGVFSPIIYKDTVIPCTKSDVFVTTEDYQNEVRIKVYQGDEYYVKNNTLIEEFLVKDVPSGKAGTEQIGVAFSYNANGILEVEATVESTRKITNRIIDMHKREKDNLGNISNVILGEAWTKSENKIVNEDNQSYENRIPNEDNRVLKEEIEWENKPLASGMAYIIGVAEKKIKTADSSDKKELEDLIYRLKVAIALNDKDEVEELEDKLTDTLFEMN